MKRFRQARDRGCAYLLERQRPDGSTPASYKVLTALQVCGYSNTAASLCDWIRSKCTTADGDFGPRPDKANDYRYTYPNSWIIIGAHRLGQFDLSHKGIEFLMRFWDHQTGGFYSSPPRRDADTKQDVIYTGFCGLAALYTGRTGVAIGVGRWMRTIMEAQPDFPQRLYTVYSRAKGLHTTTDTDAEKRFVVSRDATQDQFFFQPGVAGAFLGRLFQATGQKEWLALAKEYMRFAEGASDYLFRLVRAGKVGWAASVLYTLTGERKYRVMAVRVGDNLIAAQSEEGYWTAVGATKPNEDVTAEMVVWLDEIYQAVGHD